jgi:zinc/manganese transport system substrate-binding protein
LNETGGAAVGEPEARLSLTRILALVLPLALLPRPAAAKLRVVTSIETFADLARRVGGDLVDVQPLSRGSMDPHFVEAKPSLQVLLNRADLLVHVGLELEIGWLPPLLVGSRNPRIQLGTPGNLDASAGIPVLDVPTGRVDRSMGDIHPQGNPHYWIPPDNALIVAGEIAGGSSSSIRRTPAPTRRTSPGSATSWAPIGPPGRRRRRRCGG